VTDSKPSLTGGVHRLHTIEAARGLASGGVCLFHSLASLEPSNLHPVMRVLQLLTNPGWLGVDVFFVLSGWCIAERLAAARRRGESAGVFLRERALRIFPTYWAALALALALRLIAVPFNHTTVASNLPATAQGWIADLLLINPYLDVPFSLTVSWSLVYELGFYGLAAAVLVLGRRALSPVSLVILGLLLCLWPWLDLDLKPTFVLGRWPEFFAGVLGWWGARGRSFADHWRRAALLGLLLLLGLVSPSSYGGIRHMVAVGTAAALWIFSARDRVATVNPLLHALGWVGGFSYSLYLIHLAVLSPFMNLAQRVVRPSHLLFGVVWLAALSVSVAAGWCLNHWVEAPVERWRKTRWARPPAHA